MPEILSFSSAEKESAASPSFELVEGVDLLAHLGNGIIVLFAQAGEGRLVLDVGFLEVPAKLAELGLAFLVELNLGGSGAAGLLQALTELFELASKIAALLLSLGAATTFSFDLKGAK
jgi:hypothetical protein